MELKPGSDKKSGTIHRKAGTSEKDQQVAELKNRIAILENELRSKHDNHSSDYAARTPIETAEALLASIVMSSDDAIISKTLDGVVTSWNPAAELLYGYPADEAIGRQIEFIVPADRKGEVREILDKIRQGKRVEHYETVRETKDGRRIDVSITISPIIDTAGHIIGASTIARDIIGRKQGENALRLTQFAIDNFPDSAIWLTLDGSIVYVNKAACDSLGYSRDELLSMHLWDLDPGYTWERLRQLWPEKRRGRYLKFESTHVARDGRRFPVEVTSYYTKYGDKEYLITFDRDISERKRYEDALRESEEKFRALAESSAAGIVVYQDERLISVNPAAERITEYSKDELLEMRLIDVIHPDYKEMVLKHALRRQRGEPEPSLYETKIITKRGEVKWLLISVGLMMYQGKNAGVVTLLDITELKHAEERLRLTQFAVDTSMDSSIWINAEGRIIYVNDITCRDLGYTREELLSMRIWDIDPDFTHAEFRKKWAILKEKGGIKFESTHRRKDGSTFPVEVSSNYLKYQDQEYEVTFDRDITLRKRDERELFDAKAQAELYLDLMSHDITNMNQALMGYLELLDLMWESGNIDRALIDNSKDIINRSSRMIGDVKKLTRLQAGNITLKDVDVNQILSKVKSRYSSMPNSRVTINYTPGENRIVRAGDELEDVFDNLVANAIRHSTGPVIINLAVDQRILGGRLYYRITIDDTGPGIPDDLKKKLFMTIKEIGAGEKTVRRGFGLYLVRTLIDYYHGHVWVEDRVSGDHTKGARFVVMLPAVEG